MSHRYLLTLFWVLSLFFLTTGSAQAQVNFLDVLPSKDNTLYADAAGAKSNAKGQYFFAGNTGSGAMRRGILAFDVAAVIPDGATIDSVRLTLHMSRTVAQESDDIFLHRVLADWGDGTSVASGGEGNGGPSQPNDVTWVHTFWFQQMWQNNGGDFQSPADDTLNVGGEGEEGFYTWGPTPQMTAIVQQWLDEPATNFGWLLRGDESTSSTARRFDSLENTEEANRPRLRVFYSITTATEAEETPGPLRLLDTYPNPFRQATTIRYELDRPQPVTLTVYDMRGRQVATLVDAIQGAGTHEALFKAGTLPSGLYIYRLVSENTHLQRAMLLVR